MATYSEHEQRQLDVQSGEELDRAMRHRLAYHRPFVITESDEKPDKGQKGGSCNRRACQAPGAMWFNHYTDKYYCQDCARLINRANPEGWPIGSGKPAVVRHT